MAAPTTIPLADSATLPLAGLTAWQAVFEHASVAEGQRVLINGAGGGIGGFAVQLAKHAGAEVIATASARSAARVRRQGADHVIDYTTAAIGTAVDRPVDTIIDLVPGAPARAAGLIRLVCPGGVIVSATSPVQIPPEARVTAIHFVTRKDIAQLGALTRLIDTGAVAVEVTQTYPLTELDHVHRRSETGDIHGKVTIIP